MLAVGTGNQVRSPAIERLLAARLGAAYRTRRAPSGLPPAVVVASAGTQAVAGTPLPADVAWFLTDHGGDPAGFEARPLTPAMVRAAHLVITTTGAVRAEVTARHPSATVRTFTLRELARLVHGLDPTSLPGTGATTADRLARLVPLAHTRRVQVPPGRAQDDLVEPLPDDDASRRRALDQVLRAVRTVAGVVRA